jgi:hypothetical protein
VPPPHHPTSTHRKSSGLGLSSATASFTITRSMPPASESADAVRLRISCSPAVKCSRADQPAHGQPDRDATPTAGT